MPFSFNKTNGRGPGPVSHLAPRPTPRYGCGLLPGAPERRVAILVLGCLMTVYQRCIQVIRATWAAKTRPGVDVFYVYGAYPAATREELVDLAQVIGRDLPSLADGEAWALGDTILCGAADIYQGQANCVLRKRLSAFGHLANRRGYDFVYTVCATSYVDVDRLARYVAALPATGVYQGALNVHAETGYPFVSGASLLLSRDLAADLADSGPASPGEIARRIAEGEDASDNQTFLMPFGEGSTDFVMTPAFAQAPNDRSYHYHFNSGRMWEMENFHRRFFSAPER